MFPFTNFLSYLSITNEAECSRRGQKKEKKKKKESQGRSAGTIRFLKVDVSCKLYFRLAQF